MAPEAPTVGTMECDVREPVRQPRRKAGQQVEGQKASVSHPVLDIVAEDPKGPHVADQVQPSPVQEHARQKRAVLVGREPDRPRPFGVTVAGGDEAEPIKELFDADRAEAEIIKKDGRVDGNQVTTEALLLGMVSRIGIMYSGFLVDKSQVAIYQLHLQSWPRCYFSALYLLYGRVVEFKSTPPFRARRFPLCLAHGRDATL